MEKSATETSDIQAEPVLAAPDLTGYNLDTDSMSETLSKWFAKHLRMRWLELLTEFGATNMFFISGDALVLEFLREAHIRWDGSNTIPHLLHFAWAIEQFLRQMIDAGCVFRIIFFKCMRASFADLNLSSETEKGTHGPGALLARDVVMNHLKTLSVTGIDVDDSLQNWWDADWLSYLGTNSIFLLFPYLSDCPLAYQTPSLLDLSCCPLCGSLLATPSL